MIHECKKRDDCWTNISSPDFIQRQGYRGYLETRWKGLLVLRGLKKNSMQCLQNSPSESLRQEGASDTGFILRGCENLSGSGSPKGLMPGVRESEDRGTGLDSEQSLLHKAVCLFCRQEMSCNDHTGCGKGAQVRLAYSKGIGQDKEGGICKAFWKRQKLYQRQKYTLLSNRENLTLDGR